MTPEPRRRLPRALEGLGRCVLGFLLLIGCGHEQESSAIQLEVVTWWVPPERDPLDSATRLYRERYGVRVHTDVFSDDRRWVAPAIWRRLSDGPPPDVFQANAGADVQRWMLVQGHPRPGDEPPRPRCLIRDVSDLKDPEDPNGRGSLFEKIHNDVFDAICVGEPKSNCRRGGRLIAFPVNIHRLNVIYYRQGWLDEFREVTGRAYPTLDSLCGKSKRTPAFRIAVDTSSDFALSLLFLENLVPAFVGAEAYDRLFRGQTFTEWEKLGDALECLRELSASFVDPAPRSWRAALEQVRDGSADMTVMGDWGIAHIGGAIDDGAVELAPFPGTGEVFVFTSDTFAIPLRASHPREAMLFLQTLGSRSVQAAFSVKKGSIPSRVDVDVDEYYGDMHMGGALRDHFRATQRAFRDVTKLLATSGLFPYYYPSEELRAALAALVRADLESDAADRIEDVVRLIRENAPLLGLWQERLKAGNAACEP